MNTMRTKTKQSSNENSMLFAKIIWMVILLFRLISKIDEGKWGIFMRTPHIHVSWCYLVALIRISLKVSTNFFIYLKTSLVLHFELIFYSSVVLIEFDWTKIGFTFMFFQGKKIAHKKIATLFIYSQFSFANGVISTNDWTSPAAM